MPNICVTFYRLRQKATTLTTNQSICSSFFRCYCCCCVIKVPNRIHLFRTLFSYTYVYSVYPIEIGLDYILAKWLKRHVFHSDDSRFSIANIFIEFYRFGFYLIASLNKQTSIPNAYKFDKIKALHAFISFVPFIILMQSGMQCFLQLLLKEHKKWLIIQKSPMKKKTCEIWQQRQLHKHWHLMRKDSTNEWRNVDHI